MPVLAYVVFIFLGVIWISSFNFVNIADEFISADQVTFYRVLICLLIIATYTLAKTLSANLILNMFTTSFS